MADRHLLAIEFFNRAEEFAKAYNDLPPGLPPDWVRYFLLCHAVKLVLKAYLVLRGRKIEKLKGRPFGHSIKKLLDDAVDKYGLNLDSNVRSGLELLDTPHSKFWSRYPSEEAAQVILIGEFDADVDLLIKAVGIAIYGGNP
jgi:HEPN domain-containing protein